MSLNHFLLLGMVWGRKGLCDQGEGEFWSLGHRFPKAALGGTEKRVGKRMKDATDLNNFCSEPSALLRFGSDFPNRGSQSGLGIHEHPNTVCTMFTHMRVCAISWTQMRDFHQSPK